MKLNIKIDFGNESFYREANRATSLEQINESEGMKILARREIEYAKRHLAEKLIENMSVSFEKDTLGIYVVVESKL